MSGEFPPLIDDTATVVPVPLHVFGKAIRKSLTVKVQRLSINAESGYRVTTVLDGVEIELTAPVGCIWPLRPLLRGMALLGLDHLKLPTRAQMATTMLPLPRLAHDE